MAVPETDPLNPVETTLGQLGPTPTAAPAPDAPEFTADDYAQLFAQQSRGVTPTSSPALTTATPAPVPEPDPTPTADEYRQMFEQQMQDRAFRLRWQANALPGRDITPDHAARIFALAAESGEPFDVVSRNYESFARDTRIESVPYEQLVKETPGLADWILQHDRRLALVIDDLPHLSTMDKALQVGHNLTNAAAAGLVEFSRAVQGAVGAGQEFVHEGKDFLRLLGALPPVLAGWMADTLTKQAAGEPVDMVGSAVDALGTIPLPDRPPVSGRLGAARDAAVAAKLRASYAGADWFERHLYGGVEGLTNMIPSIAAGFALGPEALAGVFGAQAAGGGYVDARDAGLRPASAIAYGGVEGTIMGVSAEIPFSKLLTDLGVNATLFQTLKHQAVTGSAALAVQTELSNMHAWALLPENADKTPGEFLKEQPSALAGALISGMVALGAQTVIAHGTARVLNKLGTAAQASATVKRSPAEVANLVDTLAHESGLATVYLPVDTFREFYQTRGQNPADVAATLTGDTKAYAQAQQTGADLAVPIGAYVTKVAAVPEAATYFADVARFTPDMPNARDARAAGERASKDIDAAVRDAADTPDPGAVVADRMREQLEAAGFPSSTADIYAGIYKASFSTLGARAGVDPVQLFERYGLQISRDTVSPAPEVTHEPATVPADHEAHFAALLADARAQGYTGTDAQLRATYAERLTKAQEIATDLAHPEDAATEFDLLKAISRAGGIGIEAEGQSTEYSKRTGRLLGRGGMTDELETMLEGLSQTKTGTRVVKRGKRAGQNVEVPLQFRRSGGVPGAPSIIVRSGGKTLDRMRESINEDGSPWAGKFENLSDFVEAVDHAIRVELGSSARPTATTPAVDSVLESLLNVKAGEPWWTNELVQRELYARERTGKGKAERILGRIRWGKDRQFTIDLFTGANLSTLLHESAHFHLEVLGDVFDELASKDVEALTPTQKGLLSDYGAVLQWLGVERREQIGAAQHEQFARGFEAYLMDGKAPNPELRSTFARIRAWLVSVYRSVSRLKVDLTPDVRAVFDRLLATDDAITAAERQTGTTAAASLLTDALGTAAGLTPEERAAHAATLQAAMDRARDHVQQDLLGQLRRESEAWWQDERATVRTSLEPELARQPVYKALALLEHGLDADGQPVPEGAEFKLDKPGLLREFGPEVVSRLPVKVYADQGVASGLAAELLGFPSGSALIDALVTAPPFETTLDAAADAEMRRRHGDHLTDGSLAAEAAAAVLASRGDVFAAEVELLERLATRQTGTPPPRSTPIHEIRAQAEQRIRETKVGELRPATFIAAARRAGREALTAASKQDFRAALAAKQRQIVNAELHEAATTAKDEVDEARARWRKLERTEGTLAKGYDVDLLAAARAIRVQFGLSVPTLGQEHVWAYLAKVREYAPETYADLTAAIEAATEQPRPFRQLTVSEFHAVEDAVDNLVHLARRSRQILLEGKKVDLDTAINALTNRLREVDSPAPRETYGRAMTSWEKTKIGLMGWRAALRRTESWADAMDGGDPHGPYRKTLFEPVSEAAAQYRLAKKAALEQYLAIVKAVEGSLTTDTIDAPELGYRFGGTVELLHALLHRGNESNFRKLLLGESAERPAWGSLKDDGTVDTSRWDSFERRMWAEGKLTKASYDYAQATWDLLESLKPGAQKAHHDLYGYYFSEVTARSFETPWGTVKGGYFPVVYDPFLSADVATRANKSALEETANSVMFPTTGRGFTKARVEQYSRPLELSLKAVPLHVDKVLRFVHLEPAVKDVARVITDKGFARTLHGFDPGVRADLLMPWLERTARQIVETPATTGGGRQASAFFRGLRKRTGLNIMAANVTNALQQVTGLFIAGVKVPPGALLEATWQYVRQPKQLAADIAEKSAYMATRETGQVMELARNIDEYMLNPSTYQHARELTQRHAYYFAQVAQNFVDVVTWRGAYDVAVREGADEVGAVRRADAAVRQTQGDFSPENLSKLETSSAFTRSLTMFYSYWNMLANLHATEFIKITRDLGLKDGARRGLYVYAMAFLMPAVFSEVIMRAMTGTLHADDEHDESLTAELLSLFFGSQFRTASGFVPLVGPVANLAVGKLTGDGTDRLSVSPVVSTLQQAFTVPADIVKAIQTGKLEKQGVKDVASAIALLFGVPAGAVARPLGYAADVANKKVKPKNPVDAVRGAVVGR